MIFWSQSEPKCHLLFVAFKQGAVHMYLAKFKVLVKVLPLEDKAIELALASDFNDFEDGLQYFIAMDNESDIIITRNKKDFKNAKIPVMTAGEYIRR